CRGRIRRRSGPGHHRRPGRGNRGRNPRRTRKARSGARERDLLHCPRQHGCGPAHGNVRNTPRGQRVSHRGGTGKRTGGPHPSPGRSDRGRRSALRGTGINRAPRGAGKDFRRQTDADEADIVKSSVAPPSRRLSGGRLARRGGKMPLGQPARRRRYEIFMTFRSGFVCILGRPNAGKSTLLNALAGEKLAIVSPKPQTTRNRVLGVIHLRKAKGKSGAQVVLIDTPGVHPPDSSLGKKMMSEVREALSGCDLVLLIMDSTRRNEASDQLLFRLLEKSHTPIFLLLNKIDLLGAEKRKLLPLIEQYAKLHGFREIIPISAKKKEGLDLLLQ